MATSKSVTPFNDMGPYESNGVWYVKRSGIVTVRINRTAVESGTVVATLPVGFRPMTQIMFHGEGSTIDQISKVRIETDGKVKCWHGNGYTLANVTYIAAN